ncbi:hypothetical protein [Streptomyces sp. ZL-24]|uniref:hypothetical protein n=1 Tax=Streptomyces sp. ZL-24 TaxID=1933029 RepID=UPI0011B094CA|nr:hypothetical protein [Streptomyces sp. ZL-24]
MKLSQVMGPCWLGCGRECVPVKWFGPVRTRDGDGDMFACDDCLVTVERMVSEQLTRRDADDLGARSTTHRAYL